MKIRIDWTQPISLRRTLQADVGYLVDLNKIPTEAGVYVFGRKYGRCFEALYVGQSRNMRRRVKGHLNSLNLMKSLRDAKNGSRVLYAGKIMTRPGQRLEKIMNITERALMRHFLAEGHDLVNKQGMRLRRHEISADGRHPQGFISRCMFVERHKGE